MKVTQATSLQLGSVEVSGHSQLGSALQSRSAEKKAVTGSGGYITPTIAAHMRRTMAAKAPRSTNK